MPVGVKQFVRYWGLLLAKLAVAGGIFAMLLRFLNFLWAGPALPIAARHYTLGYDRYLVYLICLGVVYLIGIGLVYLSILDQRYRCRVCLRRLRMPIETGSWSKMLQFGRPRIEYICVYGHGMLHVPELHLNVDTTGWTEHSDYWAELCGTSSGTGGGKGGRASDKE